MDNQQLAEATAMQEEIRNLENFIRIAEKVWTGKIISREVKCIFKSNPYGVFDSAEYEMDTETKNKMLNALREHLEELKRRFSDL